MNLKGKFLPIAFKNNHNLRKCLNQVSIRFITISFDFDPFGFLNTWISLEQGLRRGKKLRGFRLGLDNNILGISDWNHCYNTHVFVERANHVDVRWVDI